MYIALTENRIALTWGTLIKRAPHSSTQISLLIRKNKNKTRIKYKCQRLVLMSVIRFPAILLPY